MNVKTMIELLTMIARDPGGGELGVTVLCNGVELPLAMPTITLEGGGAAPPFAAINVEASMLAVDEINRSFP